jgi:DNA-directed RNA polymerase specialized sigma24 family protein
MKKSDPKKLLRAARKSMKLPSQTQQALLKNAKSRLGFTTEELAAALGKSAAAIKSWLAPDGSAKHRNMPESAKILLSHVVAAQRKR